MVPARRKQALYQILLLDMLNICQGHERGVGLEIFLKSLFLLSSSETDKLILHASRNDIEDNLRDLSIPGIEIEKDYIYFSGKKIRYIDSYSSKLTSTTSSLESCLNNIRSASGLFTLPTSKDQIFYNNSPCAGYTDYLQKRFKDQHIAMNFVSNNTNLVLLTDHISLSSVPKIINEDLIINKVNASLKGYRLFFRPIQRVYFAGINPHSGEGGKFGNEDSVINSAIDKLSSLYKDIEFFGPISGDVVFNYASDFNSLLVFSHHDQGLAPFKLKSGYFAVNTTLGLDFLRTSVDHGTAFDIYGKNSANPAGCLYGIKLSLRAITDDH